jgi:hypothetical protein
MTNENDELKLVDEGGPRPTPTWLMVEGLLVENQRLRAALVAIMGGYGEPVSARIARTALQATNTSNQGEVGR